MSEAPLYCTEESEMPSPRPSEEDQRRMFYGLLPESHGQNLAVTFLYLPHSLLVPRAAHNLCEALGQLGQDEPALG